MPTPTHLFMLLNLLDSILEMLGKRKFSKSLKYNDNCLHLKTRKVFDISSLSKMIFKYLFLLKNHQRIFPFSVILLTRLDFGLFKDIIHSIFFIWNIIKQCSSKSLLHFLIDASDLLRHSSPPFSIST